MNSKDFNELVEARCSKIKATLASKGKEYSTDDDKLHSFNKAGIRSGQSREKALMGMKLKHEISIDDIILNLDKGILPTIEIIDEKIGDIINYFILLEASLVDRIKRELSSIQEEFRKYPLNPEECIKTNSLSNFNYKNKAEENSSNLLEGQHQGIDKKAIYKNKEDIGNYTYIYSGGDEVYFSIECIETGRTEWVPKKTFFRNFAVWKEDS